METLQSSEIDNVTNSTGDTYTMIQSTLHVYGGSVVETPRFCVLSTPLMEVAWWKCYRSCVLSTLSVIKCSARSVVLAIVC